MLTGVGVDCRRQPPRCGTSCSRSTCGAACSSSIPRATTSATRAARPADHGRAASPKSRGASTSCARSRPRARFIAHKLAHVLRRRRSAAGAGRRAWRSTFQQTDGDIAAVLRTLFESTEFERVARRRSSRTRCTSSFLGCAWPTTATRSRDYRPMLDWLNALGEPLVRRIRARRLSARPKPRGRARARWRGASRSRAPSAATARTCWTCAARTRPGARRELADATSPRYESRAVPVGRPRGERSNRRRRRPNGTPFCCPRPNGTTADDA